MIKPVVSRRCNPRCYISRAFGLTAALFLTMAPKVQADSSLLGMHPSKLAEMLKTNSEINCLVWTDGKMVGKEVVNFCKQDPELALEAMDEFRVLYAEFAYNQGVIGLSEDDYVVRLSANGNDSNDPSNPDPNITWLSISSNLRWGKSVPEAVNLLSNILGSEVAEDFKQSQLIWDGPEYYVSCPSDYDFDEITLSGVKECRMVPGSGKLGIWQHRQIWKGEKYAFSSESNPNHDNTKQLSITSISQGLQDTKILQNNKIFYNKYKNKF